MRRGLRGLCSRGWEFLLLGWHCQTRFSRQKTRCIVKIDVEGHNKIRAHQQSCITAAASSSDRVICRLPSVRRLDALEPVSNLLFEPTCSLHMGIFRLASMIFDHIDVTFIHSINMHLWL
jgi:hypothetical protein